MKKVILIIVVAVLSIFALSMGIAFSLKSNKNNSGSINSSSSSSSLTNAYSGTSNVTKSEMSDIDNSKVVITYVSGTENAYKIEDTTIAFSSISEDSVYRISGEFHGNITIDSGEYKFELELNGFKLASDTKCPLAITSSDGVKIISKSGTTNEIVDYREAISSDSTDDYSATIYSVADLSLQGKGELVVYSENNNGIHTKDDLKTKNLTLSVSCLDNCLKGNDSVSIESGTYNLLARQGDGIKTSNSDISTKGNQRGSVTISGGTVNIYAACDGIDASYNAIINEASETAVINIYTDKYSEYSEEITDVSSVSYIKTTTNSYNYSIKYINDDGTFTWKNATYYTSQSTGGRPGQASTTYYYYKVDRPSGYSKFIVYAYSSSQTVGQDSSYLAKSETKSINDSYDTLSLTISSSSLTVAFTNYQTTQPGGPGGGGGGQDGNTDKGDHSTKGIKASNEILISAGTINIKSYDDAIHANNDSTLENGETPTGNVTISGGDLTLYSNDDGIHADGIVSITGGLINVTYAYEGVEGSQINVSGGYTHVVTKDDGFNSTIASGTGITLSGGKVYVYAQGDGIDANSKTQYKGIVFSGSDVVVVSTSSNNSSIDTEQGYTYDSGRVLAICPSNGMGSESKNCSNFSSIGKYQTMSLTQNNFISASVSSTTTISLKMPCTLSSLVIYLGSSSASFSSSSSSSLTYDSYGLYIS